MKLFVVDNLFSQRDHIPKEYDVDFNMVTIILLNELKVREASGFRRHMKLYDDGNRELKPFRSFADQDINDGNTIYLQFVPDYDPFESSWV